MSGSDDLDLVDYANVNLVGNLGADGVVGLDFEGEIINCFVYCHERGAENTEDLIFVAGNNG